MYLNLFMCLHVVCVLTILIMPRFLRSEKSVANQKSTTSVDSKENVSNDIKGLETLPPNCDTNLNETKPLLNLRQQSPYTNGHKTIPFGTPPVLVRSHSMADGSLECSNDRHLLFDSDVDMRRFNEQLNHNGGGSLHQRITSGSFMHHIDAKF